MPEFRVVVYIFGWFWLVQLAHAAHPESLLEACFVMTVGVIMAACAFEAMILPAKEMTREEIKKADMMELFGIEG